jgi:hypothetical protein
MGHRRVWPGARSGSCGVVAEVYDEPDMQSSGREKVTVRPIGGLVLGMSLDETPSAHCQPGAQQ